MIDPLPKHLNSFLGQGQYRIGVCIVAGNLEVIKPVVTAEDEMGTPGQWLQGAASGDKFF